VFSYLASITLAGLASITLAGLPAIILAGCVVHFTLTISLFRRVMNLSSNNKKAVPADVAAKNRYRFNLKVEIYVME
jgi:hypothetical protein